MEFLCLYLCELQNVCLVAHEYGQSSDGLLIITRMIKMFSLSNGLYGDIKANYLQLTAVCISTLQTINTCEHTWITLKQRMNMSPHSPFQQAALNRGRNKEHASDRLLWQMLVVCAAEGKKNRRLHWQRFSCGECTWWGVRDLNSNLIRQLDVHTLSDSVWLPLVLSPCSGQFK